MECPCDKCLVYPLCKNRSLWHSMDLCKPIADYIKLENKKYNGEFNNPFDAPIMYQSWRQSLTELRNKGYL